jgi:acetyl esterase/lipase
MLKHSLVFLALCVLAAPFAAALEYEIEQDVIYGRKAGMALTFDVVTPTENANGIGLLCMMSRGWNSTWTDPEPMMAASARTKGRFHSVVAEGFTLFLVWHGSEPYFKVPDAVADMRRAVRFVRTNHERFGVDPDKLGAFGASAGGHLALMLGTTGDDGDPDAEDEVERASSRIQAVVAYFPPVSLHRFASPDSETAALQLDSDEAEAVSPVLHATVDDAPALMIHGDQDEVVPIGESEAMRDALEHAGAESELIVVEGAGHAFRGKDAGDAAVAQIEWFKEHLLN